MGLLARLAGVVDAVARHIGQLFSFVFLICMAIIVYEVTMRYGAGAPTVWAHDVTTVLCATGFLLSGVYTLHRRAHIRITVVYDRLPAAARGALDVINGLIMLAFFGLLGYQATKSAITSVGIMETAGTASQIPIPAIVKTALALACWLMLALALVHLAQVLERLFGRRGKPT